MRKQEGGLTEKDPWQEHQKKKSTNDQVRLISELARFPQKRFHVFHILWQVLPFLVLLIHNVSTGITLHDQFSITIGLVDPL